MKKQDSARRRDHTAKPRALFGPWKSHRRTRAFQLQKIWIVNCAFTHARVDFELSHTIALRQYVRSIMLTDAHEISLVQQRMHLTHFQTCNYNDSDPDKINLVGMWYLKIPLPVQVTFLDIRPHKNPGQRAKYSGYSF